jgi:acetyl-CoA acetyltransferase family protein
MVAGNFTGKSVAVVAGVRTPFAKLGGPLKDVNVTDLAKRAMEETLYRAHTKAEQLDEVILGNVVMPEDAANPARVSAIWAGVPAAVPAMTVQRNCASGMEAVADAANRIRFGQASVVMAGGAESMSKIPLLFPDSGAEAMGRLGRARNLWQRVAAAASLRPKHFRPIVGLECGLTDPTCGLIMGKTAEILAQEWNISREEQDAFALRSHQRATAAADKHAEEITPVYAGKNFDPVTADVGPRAGQTMEALAKLRPIFDKRDGSVTVGNSCQVTDGAATLLLMEEEQALAEGFQPLGYVKAYAYAGLDPARMGLGPVHAIDKLLRQTGVSLGDVDLFEINEAFAVQLVAVMRELGIDPSRVNVHGGAVALGHPIGASGARVLTTLLYAMKRRQARRGIAALCLGGGNGVALAVELTA